LAGCFANDGGFVAVSTTTNENQDAI